MEREWNKQLDSKSALRSAHAEIRDLISRASTSIKNEEWLHAGYLYGRIESLASSLRCSAELNDEMAHEQ